MPEQALTVLSQQNHTASTNPYHGHSNNPLSNGTGDNAVIPSDEWWLYKPPNLSTSSSSSIVPIEIWLREVFESPAFGFFSCRRNLLSRLEAILAAGGPIAAYRFGGSVPSLNSISQPHSSARSGHFPSSCLSICTSDVLKPPFVMPSTGSSDSISLMARRSDNINGHTINFGRLEQPNYSLPPQFSRSQRFSPASSNSISQLSHSGGAPLGRKWSGSTGKVGSCDALESLQTTVQEIARMQEDNLKADVAALVAAAAGKYGSQHSLGSHGHNTPEGSCLHLASAPGSPASSNPYLDQLQMTEKEFTGNIANPQFSRSSLEGIAHYQTDDPLPDSHDSTYAIMNSQTNAGQLLRPSSLHRLSIPVLPPKPALPVLSMRPVEVPSHVKQYGPTPPMDVRMQFGFRPMRKTSTQQFVSKPPALPDGIRRNCNAFARQSID